MEPETFKKKVVALLGTVEFLGPRFDEIVGLLTPGVEERMFDWLKAIVEKDEVSLSPGADYKGISRHKLLVFRFPFSLESGKHRILLLKVKNSWYIEFHLGNHQYYDKVRSRLGLRR